MLPRWAAAPEVGLTLWLFLLALAACGVLFGAPGCAWGLLLGDAMTLQPGKTGVWDESVLLDLDPWIIRPLEALKSTLRPDDLLCDLTPGGRSHPQGLRPRWMSTMR